MGQPQVVQASKLAEPLGRRWRVAGLRAAGSRSDAMQLLVGSALSSCPDGYPRGGEIPQSALARGGARCG